MNALRAVLLVVLTATGGLAQAEPDCSASPNPERCEQRRAQRQQVTSACSSLQGAERRACLDKQPLGPDCSQAADASRCEQKRAQGQQRADQMRSQHEACKGLRGPELRACMNPKP